MVCSFSARGDVQHSYEVVASLLISNENILYQKDYTDKETMQEFIEWIESTDDPATVVDMNGADDDDQFHVVSTFARRQQRGLPIGTSWWPALWKQ